MRSKGFSYVERQNEEVPDQLPHIIKYRYRKAAGQWPCYQTGLGIFTVNQINDGYDWTSYKQAVLDGLKNLDEGHPDGLAGLPGLLIELRYQDGFILKGGEQPIDFLNKNLEVGFKIPNRFLEMESLGDSLEGCHILFHVVTKKPKGILIVSVLSAVINGEPGIVMETVLRSGGEDLPVFEIAQLEKLLDDAHLIQKHTFDTLIKPAYARKFE